MSAKLKHQAKLFVSRDLLLPRLILFVIGLTIIAVGEAKMLKCERVESPKVTCEFIYSGFLRKHITPISSEELQNADIEFELFSPQQGDSEQNYYRIFVLSQNNKVPITHWEIDEQGVQSKLVTIKAFLNDPKQKTFSSGSDSRYINYPIGGIIFLIGVFLRTGLTQLSHVIAKRD
jgi:hypothetical protein